MAHGCVVLDKAGKFATPFSNTVVSRRRLISVASYSLREAAAMCDSHSTLAVYRSRAPTRPGAIFCQRQRLTVDPKLSPSDFVQPPFIRIGWRRPEWPSVSRKKRPVGSCRQVFGASADADADSRLFLGASGGGDQTHETKCVCARRAIATASTFGQISPAEFERRRISPASWVVTRELC